MGSGYYNAKLLPALKMSLYRETETKIFPGYFVHSDK